MTHRLLTLFMLTLMGWLMMPGDSQAQIPVIDEANLEQNTLTAVQTQEILLDSETNLLLAPGQALYPMDLVEQALSQWHGTFGPRPGSTRNLDFYNLDIGAATLPLWPGTVPTPTYPDNVSYSSDTVLNTNQSLLSMLNALVGTDADARYEGTRGSLYSAGDGAQGAMQVLQAINASILSTADAVHRLEKIAAAGANATLVATSHQIQKDAWGESLFNQSLTLAGAGAPIPPYDATGPGSFGEIPHAQGGFQQ